MQLTPRFVDLIPAVLEAQVLYICEQYETAVHKCCCGCGQKVVTPLTPTDWRVVRNGAAVSLYPSIGNWSFPCRSHYWIRNNQIEWAEEWTQDEIEAGRAWNRAAKERYYGEQARQGVRKLGFWQTLKRWFS